MSSLHWLSKVTLKNKKLKREIKLKSRRIISWLKLNLNSVHFSSYLELGYHFPITWVQTPSKLLIHLFKHTKFFHSFSSNYLKLRQNYSLITLNVQNTAMSAAEIEWSQRYVLSFSLSSTLFINLSTLYFAFFTYYWFTSYFYPFCLLMIKNPTEVSTYFSKIYNHWWIYAWLKGYKVEIFLLKRLRRMELLPKT